MYRFQLFVYGTYFDCRYQIAESISTESKYFHDFQAIADQFRFLDKTKGTIPKVTMISQNIDHFKKVSSI